MINSPKAYYCSYIQWGGKETQLFNLQKDEISLTIILRRAIKIKSCRLSPQIMVTRRREFKIITILMAFNFNEHAIKKPRKLKYFSRIKEQDEERKVKLYEVRTEPTFLEIRISFENIALGLAIGNRNL